MGSQQGQQQFGLTPPISLAAATEPEVQLNRELIEELKRQGSFESQEETNLRAKVLQELQKMASEFVYRVGIAKNMPEQVAREAGGKIFTYGSFRLGVYGPGSDIDSLVVAPRHVQREDFFAVFEPMLRERPEVKELAAVPDAFVPIIKMEFSGISIDLIFARLAIPQVPLNLDLSDNNLLRNISETDVRSLNGTRVTDEILKVVPNANVFKHALRTIKLWAQRRAIYSNVMGFPGGVAWAMLVARICQLYPNAVSAVIVSKFFRVLQQWAWPQPVLLKPIEDGPLQVRVWNPKLYHGDRAHRMPIITPAYPSMCATHNISASTQTVILKEFARAIEIMDRITLSRAPWSALFDKHDFFHRYKNYLVVVAASRDADTQLKWSGLVESKIRQLVMRLEVLDTIAVAHPYVKSFDSIHDCADEEEAAKVAAGEASGKKVAQVADLKEIVKEGVESVAEGLASTVPAPPGEATNAPATDSVLTPAIRVYTTSFYIGIEVDRSDNTKRLDITWAAQEFTDKCNEWPSYDASKMSVRIKHTRNTDLSDECFDVGEARPVKHSSGDKKSKKRKQHDTQESSDSLKRQQTGTVAA
ncbi:polynucleotide adenylyltransferase [Savitreella phatthalungensis]